MNTCVTSSLLVVLAALPATSAAARADCMVRVAIDRDAVYTPGNVQFTFQLTPGARLAGSCNLRITVSVAGSKVRERTMSIAPAEIASYDLSFPRVHAITPASYRVELSLGGEFLEAREGRLALWPPRDPRPEPWGAEVWVLDTSGLLQNLLPEFGLTPADASFQAVRDFGHPDVIFVGENLDGPAMESLAERIASPPTAPVVVLLRQGRFPEELGVSVGRDTDPCHPVVRELNSPLVRDLSGHDVMRLLDGSEAIEVERWGERAVRSHLTIAKEDAKMVVSWLCVVEQTGSTLLFCQLPATARDDPRQMTLLGNLVQFARRRTDRADPNLRSRIERAEP